MMTVNNLINNPKTSNIDKLTNIQLNTSNADWETKSNKLLTTIIDNSADICIISESNAEIKNQTKINNRNNLFDNYNIEDKAILNQSKAGISIVIHKNIKYTRCKI